MDNIRPFDQVATDLIDDANEKVHWARKAANKLLAKANDIEEMAAVTANKYREAAASLILEASSYADGVADVLTAEYPMGGDDDESEEGDGTEDA